jgi:hypothetical protein
MKRTEALLSLIFTLRNKVLRVILDFYIILREMEIINISIQQSLADCGVYITEKCCRLQDLIIKEKWRGQTNYIPVITHQTLSSY